MRQLALLLLDDEYGISAEAWSELRVLLESDDGNDDILTSVRSADGRYYLPEDFNAVSH